MDHCTFGWNCWTTIVFVGCCLAAPLSLMFGSSVGVQVADGLFNTTKGSWPPEPASDLKCFGYDFHTVTCNWTRGGQNSQLNSTDILMYKQFRRGAELNICRSHEPYCTATSCTGVCAIGCYRCDYVVRTTNALNSSQSEPVYFNLNEHTTLNPPWDVRVTNVSMSQLQVQWNFPKGPDEKSSIKFTLQHRWEGNINWTEQRAEGAKIKDGIVTYILKDLDHAYGKYYIRVKAWRDKYTPFVKSKFSEIAEGRTTEITPKDKPTHFSCSSKSNSNNDTRQVHLSWKPVENLYKRNGELLGYVITYTSSNSNKLVKMYVGVNDTNHTVYDLRKDQHYTFNIETRNSMGTSGTVPCPIDPVPPEPVPIMLVVGCCIGFLLLVIFIIITWKYVKGSIRKFPDIRLPPPLVANNEYLSGTANQMVVLDAEVFDELVPCQLFVDLGPKEPSEGAIFNDVMTDGFDIGDKPQGAAGFQDDMPVIDFENHPLLGLKGDLMLDEAPLSTDPLLPGPRREEDPSSGEEYGGAWPSSPVSVGSGGSYLHIRDEDELTYSCMTKEGLSPIEKDDTEGQRLRGERPTDSVSRPHMDELPRLFFRQESADEDSDNLHDGDMSETYLKMSKPLPPHEDNANAGPMQSRKETEESRLSMENKNKSVEDGNTKEDVAGANCVGDGSMSSYVQQSFVPGTACQGESYGQTDNLTFPGMHEGTAAATNPNDTNMDASNLGLPEPSMTNDRIAAPSPSRTRTNKTPETPEELRAGRDSRSEGYSSGEEIDSYVLNAGPVPSKRLSQDSSQLVQDLNPLLSSTSGGPEAVSPFRMPVPQVSETNEPLEIPNTVQAQSLESLSDGGLNYVAVGLDSDSHNQEGMDGNEPTDISGYVTQGLMPNFTNPQLAGTVAGGLVHDDTSSSYVDQAQLSNLPPATAQSPAHNNEIQENGTVQNGYITTAEVRDTLPSSPAVNSVNRSSMNNNNNNSRTEHASPGVQIPTDIPVLDRGHVPQDQGHELHDTNQDVSDSSLVNGVPLNPPASPSYVTTDQLASVCFPSPQENGHVNRNYVGLENTDYITHEQMLNMAEGSGDRRPRPSKNSPGQVEKHTDRQCQSQ